MIPDGHVDLVTIPRGIAFEIRSKSLVPFSVHNDPLDSFYHRIMSTRSDIYFVLFVVEYER